jgi:hypothetical protein
MKKELEQLINYAIADGVITEKEREILRKKAVEMGVDPDEVEMVLEGRLGEKMQRENFNALKSQMRKCPNCGDVIPITSGVCPSCNFVFDNQGQDIKLLSDLDRLYVDISESKKIPGLLLNLLLLFMLLALWCYSVVVGNGLYITLAVLLTLGYLAYIFFSRIRVRENEKWSVEELRGKFNTTLANARYVYSKDKKISDRIATIERRANQEFKLRDLIKYSFFAGMALLGVLFVLMICLPNAKHNAEDCTKKVSVLLDEGNVKEAIDCVLEYEGKFTWIDSELKHFEIESSIIEVARHGIKTGLNEEVRSFIKKRLNDDYSGRETVEKIVSVCLELDRYDMAKFINEEYKNMYSLQIRKYLIDKEEYEEAEAYYKGWEYDSYIKDVVTKMCKVNIISEARKFLKAKINLIQDKEDRQKTLNELNALINSY